MGAPNVYDTTYVNSGPGVGLSSSGGSRGISKDYTPEYSDSSEIMKSLAASTYGLARTNPGAEYIRENFENPNNSAYMSSLYDNFIANNGIGYDMDEYFDRIQDMSDANNKWSADQAQKQMDFQQMTNARAMAWSAKEAQTTRDWQERLTDTAHQREVRDLVAAGLNPILSANKGASTGSGATGQGFSSSGAMGQTDTSNTAAISSLFNNVLTTARDLAITKMQVSAQRYNADQNYASSKLAAEASIYNSQNAINANKAISQLNRDADITKAGISADASRAAAAMSAGAVMSAASTNAAAARYSADQHVKQSEIQAGASMYGADTSAGASMYGSDKSYDANMYKATHDIKSDPAAWSYNSGFSIGKEIIDVANGLKDIVNVQKGSSSYSSSNSGTGSGRKF